MRRYAMPVAFASLAVLAVVVAPLLAAPASRDVMLACVPESALPGSTLPVVAELLEDVDEFGGGRRVPVAVDALLVDGTGASLARASLERGVDGRARANLRLPDARAVLQLELRVRGRAEAPRLRARIRVDPSADVVPRTRRPRVVGVSPTSDAWPLRAEGGACAPSLPCRVYLAMPPGGGDASFVAGEGTSLIGSARARDLVRLEVRIDGFGGRLEVRPSAADAAPEELGVPVQLGAGRLRAREAYSRSGSVTLSFERSLPPASVQLDRYVGGRWVETRVFDDAVLASGAHWPSLLPSGVHRFEARDDTGTTLASAVVVVSASPGSPPWTRPSDVFAADDAFLARRTGLVLAEDELDDEVRAASSLGLLSGSLERPPMLDSRVQRAMGSASAPSASTRALAGAVLVLGLLASAYVAHEGRRARREADALLAEVGHVPMRGEGARGLLPFTVLLAFVAAAAMVLYRG